jgi:hypothetical protein
MTRVSRILLATVPAVVLLLLIVASATAEIVLDHEILGLDANGMPVLAFMPVVQGIIAAWNLAVIYLAPPALAILFLLVGTRRHWNLNALMIGGAAACIIGGFLNLEAVWTGVKGTSYLDVGLVESVSLGVARALVNLVLFGAAAFLFIPRR